MVSSMLEDKQARQQVNDIDARRCFLNNEKLSVIVIGGSIAGLSCAHALLKSGVCRVMVTEKARALTSNVSGAGISMDAAACEAIEDWGLLDELKLKWKPLDFEENRAVDTETKKCVTLSRDDNYRHWGVHWSELHRTLRDSLPAGIVHFNHEAISVENSEDGTSVKVRVARGGDREEIMELQADLIVAADGSMSRIRQYFAPTDKRRYTGYCAWRGVFDYNHHPKIAESIRESYPDIGNCLYSDIALNTHAVVYELPGRRLNWLWYVNQPEPVLKGNSLTVQPDKEVTARMHEEADCTWVPALAELIKATSQPFINAIFERTLLKQVVFKRVVLVGEAAHATTPHAARSTNMSIVDAHVLGKAIAKWGSKELDSALAQYEMKRVPATSQQVLFSKHIGSLKQGLLFKKKGSSPWPTVENGMLEGLLQRNMSNFRWTC